MSSFISTLPSSTPMSMADTTPSGVQLTSNTTAPTPLAPTQLQHYDASTPAHKNKAPLKPRQTKTPTTIIINGKVGVLKSTMKTSKRTTRKITQKAISVFEDFNYDIVAMKSVGVKNPFKALLSVVPMATTCRDKISSQKKVSNTELDNDHARNATMAPPAKKMLTFEPASKPLKEPITILPYPANFGTFEQFMGLEDDGTLYDTAGTICAEHLQYIYISDNNSEFLTEIKVFLNYGGDAIVKLPEECNFQGFVSRNSMTIQEFCKNYGNFKTPETDKPLPPIGHWSTKPTTSWENLKAR